MFANSIWWITGASSGIGAALAEALAQQGAKLILSGRNIAALEEVAARSNQPAFVLPFEATDFATIPSLVRQAWDWANAEGGAIDGLISSAGISQRSLAAETTFEVYQRVVTVDLLAPIALTQALLPKMIAAGGGHVVALSSVSGLAGFPLRSAYCAAKHGLVGYHDSIRSELEHLGLKVLVVAPGPVRTNISRNALDAQAKPREVSDPIIDNGMDPTVVAGRILDAVTAGTREFVLAEGIEAEMVRLRREDPDALFDMMGGLVTRGYAKRMDSHKRSRT